VFVIGRDQRHANKEEERWAVLDLICEQYLKGIMYMHAFSIFANNKISSMINS
jgi:hypothetical protein